MLIKLSDSQLDALTDVIGHLIDLARKHRQKNENNGPDGQVSEAIMTTAGQTELNSSHGTKVKKKAGGRRLLSSEEKRGI